MEIMPISPTWFTIAVRVRTKSGRLGALPLAQRASGETVQCDGYSMTTDIFRESKGISSS